MVCRYGSLYWRAGVGRGNDVPKWVVVMTCWSGGNDVLKLVVVMVMME